ncbi:hypothetical protein McanCB49686_007539 [Microsporum canis]
MPVGSQSFSTSFELPINQLVIHSTILSKHLRSYLIIPPTWTVLTAAMLSSTSPAKKRVKGSTTTNPRETWEGLYNNIHSIGRSYLENDSTAFEIEGRLHDLWDELIHAARITPALSPEHDRLVVLILEARELGPFPVNKKDGDSLPPTVICDMATLPNGQRLWADFLYLVQEIQDS